MSEMLGEKYELAPAVTAARSDEATGSSAQGIRVHGAWTITVRNPDGSLDAKRSFENELRTWTHFLPEIFGRVFSPGKWEIQVGGDTECSHPYRPRVRAPDLAEGRTLAGRREIQLDTSSLSSGIYFLRLTTETATRVRRLVILD